MTKTTVSLILAGIVAFGNQLVPVLPLAWGNLIAAILGIVGLYYHAQVVAAARAAGVKGL